MLGEDPDVSPRNGEIAGQQIANLLIGFPFFRAAVTRTFNVPSGSSATISLLLARGTTLTRITGTSGFKVVQRIDKNADPAALGDPGIYQVALWTVRSTRARRPGKHHDPDLRQSLL